MLKLVRERPDSRWRANALIERLIVADLGCKSCF